MSAYRGHGRSTLFSGNHLTNKVRTANYKRSMMLFSIGPCQTMQQQFVSLLSAQGCLSRTQAENAELFFVCERTTFVSLWSKKKKKNQYFPSIIFISLVLMSMSRGLGKMCVCVWGEGVIESSTFIKQCKTWGIRKIRKCLFSNSFSWIQILRQHGRAFIRWSRPTEPASTSCRI